MWRNWASRSRCWRPSLTLRWPGANTPAGATVAHRTSRHLEALTDQLVSQLGRRLRRPTQLRHRVAPSLGVHELVEGLQESGLLRLGFDVTAADGALAVRGHDPGLHLPLGLDHSVTAHPRRGRHCSLAAPTQHLRHRTGHHPPLHLVHVRNDHLEKSRESLGGDLAWTLSITASGPFF